MRILGLDPGLRVTGWGVVQVQGSELLHVANGAVLTKASGTLGERLAELHAALEAVADQFEPDNVAIEEIFVNRNPRSTLKLGQARGVAILVPARRGIPVTEYSPYRIKKAVCGVGHAGKAQIRVMVGHLLPKCQIGSDDAADALAIAICHSSYRSTLGIWEGQGLKELRV